MSIIVIINFAVKQDKQTEFATLLDNVKTTLPQVNGCLGVEIFQNASTKQSYTLIERWQTQELHQAHLDRLSADGTWDIIAAHLSQQPSSDYFIQR